MLGFPARARLAISSTTGTCEALVSRNKRCAASRMRAVHLSGEFPRGGAAGAYRAALLGLPFCYRNPAHCTAFTSFLIALVPLPVERQNAKTHSPILARPPPGKSK